MASPMEEDGVAQAPAQKFELPLIALVQRAQGEHGVKHSEFTRYRHHCTNKLKGLYKSLKLQHGRTKFVKRKIEPATVTDARYLHVPVFCAERAWAYAMELKKEVESRMDLRKRRHLVARMAKASLHAREAANLASKCCDARSALEAEAYALGMGASLLLEKEVQWERALARFTRAKKLYTELARVATDAEAQSLYLQQVENLEPGMRYCSYQISRAGQAVPEEGSLLRMADEQGENLDQAAIQQYLETMATQTVSAQASTTTYVEWPPGNLVPARSERVREAVQQANDLAKQMDQIEVTPVPSNSMAAGEVGTSAEVGSGRVPKYDRLLQALQAARTQAHAAMKVDSGAPGGHEELVALDKALTGLIAQRSVDRAALISQSLGSRFGMTLLRASGAGPAGGAAAGGGKKAEDKGGARAAQVVRALDTLMRALTELADLGVQGGGRAGEQLHDAAMLQVARARASRCYYVAHSLMGSHKSLEAFALFSRAAERAQEAAAESVPETPVSALVGHVATQKDMEALAQNAAAYKAVAQAEAAASVVAEQEKVTSGVEKLALEQQAAAAARSLAEAPDQFESFAGSAAGAKGAPRVFKLPYPMQAIPMRPIMLDTAFSHITYPDLTHRVSKAESQKGTGVFKSLTSWAWGGSGRK